MKITNLKLFALLAILALGSAVRMSATSTSSSNDDDYWTGLCLDTDILQSPINILPPFTYIEFDATFTFYPQQNGELVNSGGHYLKMEGDFGYFEYKDTIFDAYLLHFISPSEHTIGTTYKKFPMELQIYAVSQDGLQINIAILFSTSTEDGDFLTDLGFGNGVLEYLEDDQSYEAPHAVDISKVIPSNNDFFIYQGTNTYPSCEPAIWFVSFETFKISERQLNDFPKVLLNEGRPQQPTQSREIYVTFSETKYEALQSSYSSTSSSSTSSSSTTTSSTVAKNELYDAFIIVGAGDSIYNCTIYPFSSVSSTPRPIRTGDYLVVTNPNTTNALDEFLTINDKILNSAISEIEKLNDVSTNYFTATHKINVSDVQGVDVYAADYADVTATSAIQMGQKAVLRGKSSRQVAFEPAIEKRDTSQFFGSYSSKSHKSGARYSFLELQSSFEVTMDEKVSKTANFFKSVEVDTKITTGATSSLSLKTSPQAFVELKASSEVQPVSDAMIETASLAQLSTDLQTTATTSTTQLEQDDEDSTATNSSNSTLTYILELDGAEVIDEQNWPDLCRLSWFQSPVNVDLNSSLVIEPNPLTFNYNSSNTTAYSVTNDGYKIVINGSFGEMKYGEHSFEAYSLTLHHPSEHSIGPNMTRSDFELQILHYDAFGIQSVVAVLFDSSSDEGEASDFLTAIGLAGNDTQALAVGSTNVVTGLDLLELVNDSEHYISYDGSITSPPCTERVKWFILNKKNSCSTAQVDSFATLFGAESNIRGLQQLNNRLFSLF